MALDPSYPRDRVQFIVGDSGASHLLVDQAFLAMRDVCGPGTLCVCVSELATAAEGSGDLLPAPSCESTLGLAAQQTKETHTTSDRPPETSPNDEAYVIYTSGSTGRPKGVMVRHRNAFHLVNAEQLLYGVVPSDRVLQGFSVAFDASVEEMWVAWRAGATLVAGTPDIMHLGPDLAAKLVELGITVLSCVPTLLTVLTPVQTVRMLISGGEALSADLLAGWHSPHRRIFNTYGPTEATVVATVALCQPDEPITIGLPLPNYTTYIMDESATRILPRGEEGELVIGGPGVAKGYLGRAELTTDRFVSSSAFASLTGDSSPTLYRTGDLARMRADGRLDYLGRIDTQVKVRGFRVELAEIETAVRDISGAANCVVMPRQVEGLPDQALVAYVQLPRRAGGEQAQTKGSQLDETSLLSGLRARLPPYMVPSHFEVLHDFPTLSSGKVDRKAFPAPAPRTPAQVSKAPEFESKLQQAIYMQWAGLFGTSAITNTDDFFVDLGGHSMLAARFVSAMRAEQGCDWLAVADVYTHPTLAGLAHHMEQWMMLHRPSECSGSKPQREVLQPFAPSLSAFSFVLSGVVQAVSLCLLVVVACLQWILPYAVFLVCRDEGLIMELAVAGAAATVVATAPLTFVLCLLLRWLILGRVHEGDYPLWGWFYLRFTLVDRLLTLLPLRFLRGTALMAWYLRSTGCRIGRNVVINSIDVTGFDLLELGDDVTINTFANVSVATVERGLLRLRHIQIGKGAYIGVRAAISPGAFVGSHAVVADMTSIGWCRVVAKREHWAGSPGQRQDAESAAAFEVERLALLAQRSSSVRLPSCLCTAVSVLTLLFMPVYTLLPSLLGILFVLLYCNTWLLRFAATPFVAALYVCLSLLQVVVVVKWLLLGRGSEGVYHIHSAVYLRKWIFDRCLETTMTLTKTIYATLYVLPWLRAVGVDIGPCAEVSTATLGHPDLVAIGAQSFVADDALLGATAISEQHAAFRRTVVGARTFVGNSAYVPDGSRLGNDCLLGVQSMPAQQTMPDSTAWLGCPAMQLKRRQAPSKVFSMASTFQPSRRLYAQRLCFEFVRVILPSLVFLNMWLLVVFSLDQLSDLWGLETALCAIPLLFSGVFVAGLLITLALKWVVVGRYRPMEAPLWSTFVWRTELVTGFCDTFTNPHISSLLRGTVFLPMYLRLMGCTVGARACLLAEDITEFDLVTMGDHVTVNKRGILQTHLFEDRVMKLGPIALQDRATVGSDTVILYDTVVGQDVTIEDLSLLMKGERLPASTRWEGIPVRRAQQPEQDPLAERLLAEACLVESGLDSAEEMTWMH